MKNTEKKTLREIQDRVYEEMYPYICEVMEKLNYKFRSPNWWSTNTTIQRNNISTHLVKDVSIRLAMNKFDSDEFKLSLETELRKEIE